MRARGGVAAVGGIAVLVTASLGGPETVPRGDLALGESVYKEICFACHGATGDGKGPSWLNTMPRPQVFTDTNYMSRLTDQYLFEVIKYGKLAVLKREIKDSRLEALAMPSFGHLFEDAQVRELIAFERAFRRPVRRRDPGRAAVHPRDVREGPEAMRPGLRVIGVNLSEPEERVKAYVADMQPLLLEAFAANSPGRGPGPV
jgi:cytochrome c553